MNQREMLQNRITVVLGNIQYLIRLLYAVGDDRSRYLALHDLWNQVAFLQSLIQLLGQTPPTPEPIQQQGWPPPLGSPQQAGPAPAPGRPAAPAPTASPPGRPTGLPPTATPGRPMGPPPAPALQEELPPITQAELATKTGRGGNPAYVAVNGIVYDVTNNAAWSLGTHFDLPAGRDLTREFASCHAGQQWILATLRPVGRLV